MYLEQLLIECTILPGLFAGYTDDGDTLYRVRRRTYSLTIALKLY